VNFEIGTEIELYNNNGAGVITIAITTDTLRLSGGSAGSRTLAANGACKLVKVSATEWLAINWGGLT